MSSSFLRSVLLAAAASLSLSGCTATALSYVERLDVAMFDDGETLTSQTGYGVDLRMVATPLPRVAAGQVARPAPPDLVGDFGQQMAIGNSINLARAMVGGALTGGLGVAVAMPSLAYGVATSDMRMARMQDAQAALEQAYAEAERERIEAAVVPDVDRPAEAAALLEVVDAPAGAAADWINPATGAVGRVEVMAAEKMIETITCRPIRRSWRLGGMEREGDGAICRQNGVWYDMG